MAIKLVQGSVKSRSVSPYRVRSLLLTIASWAIQLAPRTRLVAVQGRGWRGRRRIGERASEGGQGERFT